ncbi:MAG TPA: glycosyl transferase family 1 [Caulobacterales bacterium]|nr:glycosyl transferase family 1 [Caulobacterales bacterium]
MSIAYFAHELADPAVQKRVRMLRAGGGEIELLGFERRRFAGDAQAPAPHILGRTANGKLFARVFSVLAALPRAWRLRDVWGKADALLARNLEMLAIVTLLAAFTGSRRRIVYECLDIHRLMLSRGPVGVLMRAIERACLAHIALVITSSPAFDARYFRAVQNYRGETLVVENKVLALSGAARAQAVPAAGPPWTIAWCGVLRCRQSLRLLRRLADEHGELVRIELWGAPALDQIPDFHEVVAGSPRMRFNGAYKPEDLPAIYGAAHFVWAIDYYEAGGNSDWLLPNRLYEGLYFGAPPIAVTGVETARWLTRHGVGVVVDPPLHETLTGFLESCTPQRYGEIRAAAQNVDLQSVAVTLDFCRALLARLTRDEAA